MQVGNFDTAGCTVFGTNAEVWTIGAFFIIYHSDIVNNLYSIEGAYTFTLFAAYTAVEAIFSCNSTFIMVAARYNDIFRICNKRYKTVWTGSCAKTTAHAVNGIDNSGICDYGYSILGTGVCTVP